MQLIRTTSTYYRARRSTCNIRATETKSPARLHCLLACWLAAGLLDSDSLLDASQPRPPVGVLVKSHGSVLCQPEPLGAVQACQAQGAVARVSCAVRRPCAASRAQRRTCSSLVAGRGLARTAVAGGAAGGTGRHGKPSFRGQEASHEAPWLSSLPVVVASR